MTYALFNFATSCLRGKKRLLGEGSLLLFEKEAVKKIGQPFSYKSFKQKGYHITIEKCVNDVTYFNSSVTFFGHLLFIFAK